MTYNARLRRARLQLHAEDCQLSRKPPADLLLRIQQKLEEELEEGFIEAYVVFTKRLEDFWHYVREHTDEIDPKHVIRMTIAQGARLYPQIQLTPGGKDPHQLALLSCRFDPRTMETLSFNAFVFNIYNILGRMKISQSPDRAQLRFLYLLLTKRQPLDKVPLLVQPKAEDFPGKTFTVRFHAQYRYATLHIFDRRLIVQRGAREELIHRAQLKLQQLNTEKVNLEVFGPRTREKLQSLMTKMQALGFHMPYDLLFAYDPSYQLEKKSVEEEKAAPVDDTGVHEPWRRRALGQTGSSAYFDFHIDKEGMHVTIDRVHEAALAEVRKQITKDWLVRQLAQHRIVFGYADHLDEWWQAIQDQRKLQGLRVASGEPAQPGQKALIHLLVTDPEEYPNEQVDVRDLQNRLLVRQGQRVAELRFDDGTPGKNVFGRACHALAQSSVGSFSTGEGVRLDQDGRFYATRDGLLDLQGQTLSCQTVYIHPGSVHLASGNLVFEGSVVVQGDIESGAYVRVKGQLVVEGMIGPSRVHCSGSVTVKGGIVTGSEGWLRAGGDVRCEFIENSQIEAKGTVAVQRSVLNSSLIVGGYIHVLDERQGLISGGLVSSWSGIRTVRLGLGTRQNTECRIGSNFNQERRLLRLRTRLQAIQAYSEQLQKTLRDAESSQRAASPASTEQINQVRARIQKCFRIIDKLKQLQLSEEQKLVWNHRATLVVAGRLDRAVAIFTASKRISLENHLEAVLVSGTPYRGSQLVDLSRIEDYRRQFPDACIVP